MRKLIFIIVGLFMAGCLSEMPPDSMKFVKKLELTFEVEVVSRDEQIDEFSIETQPGTILIGGYFWTPQAGYTLTADIGGDSETTILNVTGEHTHIGITIPVQYAYNVVISEVPSGTYVFKINHILDDHTETAFETVVTVV